MREITFFTVPENRVKIVIYPNRNSAMLNSVAKKIESIFGEGAFKLEATGEDNGLSISALNDNFKAEKQENEDGLLCWILYHVKVVENDQMK